MASTRASELTITYEQFIAHADDFLRLSDALGDGWELKKMEPGRNHVVHYLAKRCTIVLPQLKRPSCDEYEQDLQATVDEEEDVGAVSKESSGAESRLGTALSCEYHVIYSPSYQVPVLHFTASYLTGKLVLLKDLWQLLPIENLIDGNGKWGVLTDIEHPLLCRPFYHIHPCHTAKVMSALLPKTGDHVTTPGCHDNYVLTWLSVFGPLVGLPISLEYGKRLLNYRATPE